MAVKSDTEITVTVGSALTAAVALVVGMGTVAWIIGSLVFGEVKDDVAVIREDLSALRAKSDEKVTVLEASGGDVEKALVELAVKLEVTNERLLDLSDSLKAVDQRLSASIARQQEFERFIVTRLPAPTSIPEGWAQSQKEIVTEISSGADPLLLWFQSVPREQ